jgi:NAD(P)-dependent dehydrogenase (short-subunit alcohol dehydrogenase family)
MNLNTLRDTLELNVVTPCALNNIIRPKMSSGSSILYLGSTLSEKAVANTASYVTSKHAVVGLMRSTTQDLIGTGIHSAAVCPGFTATEMLLTHLGDNEEVRAFLEGMSAFNRLIDPMEIAKTLLFCSSSPVINGSVIHANLGQVER